MLPSLLSYIRSQNLLRPGERVGVAVSGGADSVALLRGLVELRAELGIVLSVIHFHHGIRGAEADADAEFVAHLAKRFELPLHPGSGDVPYFSKKWKLSLEAAARRLRYDMFRSVLLQGDADKICTAHTRDDQAETVLLRMLRGAGTKGLGGIHPLLKFETGAVIRPMLTTSRAEVLSYLTSIGQDWREDSTNIDTRHTRNRVRHELLPLLERDYNPAIREVLCETAEAARDEEIFWTSLMTGVAATALDCQEGILRVRFSDPALKAKALQRRLLRLAAERVGVALDFHHVEQVLGLLKSHKGSEVELPNGWRARHEGAELLTLATRNPEIPMPVGYDYELPIPGEARIDTLDTLVRVTTVPYLEARRMYNPASLLDGSLLRAPLRLRNWRPGDRLHPLHRGSEEKLKRLFQERRISAERRQTWPVLTSGDAVVWAKDFAVSTHLAAHEGTVEAVLVEVTE